MNFIITVTVFNVSIIIRTFMTLSSELFTRRMMSFKWKVHSGHTMSFKWKLSFTDPVFVG